jgi:hypothetical protein
MSADVETSGSSAAFALRQLAGVGRVRERFCPKAAMEVREPNVNAVAASTHSRQPRRGHSRDCFHAKGIARSGARSTGCCLGGAYALGDVS